MSEMEDEEDNFDPLSGDDSIGREVLARIDTGALDLYKAHADLYVETDEPSVLHLEFSRLEELATKHCYGVVETGIYLGRLVKKLAATRRKMEKLKKFLYRKETDRVITPVSQPGSTSDRARSKNGIQKMDAEYRAYVVVMDKRYEKLQKREEALLERIEIVRAIAQAQRDKSEFIKRMLGR